MITPCTSWRRGSFPGRATAVALPAQPHQTLHHNRNSDNWIRKRDRLSGRETGAFPILGIADVRALSIQRAADVLHEGRAAKKLERSQSWELLTCERSPSGELLMFYTRTRLEAGDFHWNCRQLSTESHTTNNTGDKGNYQNFTQDKAFILRCSRPAARGERGYSA